MEDKTELYANQIHPLVEQIAALCKVNKLPMVMAFCLDRQDAGLGKRQMTVAGITHLERDEEPPQPMVLAATIMRVPGFNVGLIDAGEVY